MRPTDGEGVRERLIMTARKERPAELLLKNAGVLNVFTGEIAKGNVAIESGFIAGVGDYTEAARVDDLEGRHLVPGFINSHCHVESSMVLPGVYCAEELRNGVTTLITDPHEVANVAGVRGILFMLEATENLPIDYYIQLPSCVPATAFEHSGAALAAHDLAPLLSNSRVPGLGEMMNYPGVLNCEPRIMEMLDMAQGRVIDGHAPGLRGPDLQAYAAAGIHTDHESVTFAEAMDKIRAGMAVLVREGSASKNLEGIISGVVAGASGTDRMAFCTDDKHIADVVSEGTISFCIRKSIELGLSVTEAYRMASYNAARIFSLRGLGAIAPGWRADLVSVGDLAEVTVDRVYKNGSRVFPEQVLAMARGAAGFESGNSVNFAPLCEDDLKLQATADGLFPVIGVMGGQIITTKEFISARDAESGLSSRKLCKAAVVERHHATGNAGVALLSGYGLRRGAIASTVGHDSHNLIVVGTNDEDMLAAAEEIRRIQGGFVFVVNGVVEGEAPLPVFGLMNDGDEAEFIEAVESLIKNVRASGVPDGVDPLITLSFLALPTIPALRVTDMGVFDVEEFWFVTRKSL